jgi:hypothetical protein
VAILSSHRRKSKLEPRGEMGQLVGFNPELKSYCILTEEGVIINSKNVTFLDYVPPEKPSNNWDKLLLKEKAEPLKELIPLDTSKKEEAEIKEEDEDDQPLNKEGDAENSYNINDDSDKDENDVAHALIPDPEPVRQVLRDCTLQVKPIKYSHFTEDLTSFKKAVSGSNAERWTNAIKDKLDNIERHKVWLDHSEKRKKFLHSTWVFKTKPATLSSQEKQKACLCIQGFLQTYGEDFFETFAPTGKFPSLLTLLVLAIDLKLPIKQFDMKSAFLFAPLEEEIYIKTPEGSTRTAPYLKLVKSLYGLKQAPKNWYDTLMSWLRRLTTVHQSQTPAYSFTKTRTLSYFFMLAI